MSFRIKPRQMCDEIAENNIAKIVLLLFLDGMKNIFILE